MMRIRHLHYTFVAIATVWASSLRAGEVAGPEDCPIDEAGWCEVRAVALGVGVDYLRTVTGAAKGDVACLRRLLRLTTTKAMNDRGEVCGIARYTHGIVLSKLLGRVGDGKFALAVSMVSAGMRAAILADLDWREEYLARWYPRSAVAFGRNHDRTPPRAVRGSGVPRR